MLDSGFLVTFEFAERVPLFCPDPAVYKLIAAPLPLFFNLPPLELALFGLGLGLGLVKLLFTLI